MPPDVDPNALTLALILTAAGVVPAAALVTGVVSLLGNLGSIMDGRERVAAFFLSLILVVYAYIAIPVPLTGISGFAGFLAFLAIGRGSMAVYDEVKGKVGSLRGPSA